MYAFSATRRTRKSLDNYAAAFLLSRAPPFFKPCAIQNIRHRTAYSTANSHSPTVSTVYSCGTTRRTLVESGQLRGDLLIPQGSPFF